MQKNAPGKTRAAPYRGTVGRSWPPRPWWCRGNAWEPSYLLNFEVVKTSGYSQNFPKSVPPIIN